MSNMEKVPNAELIENVKRIQSSQAWQSLEELVGRKITETRDLLERSRNMEDIIRLQTKIKTWRSLLTLDVR